MVTGTMGKPLPQSHQVVPIDVPPRGSVDFARNGVDTGRSNSLESVIDLRGPIGSEGLNENVTALRIHVT